MNHVLVVDASVVLDLLARFDPAPLENLLWAPGALLTAPELIDIEVLNALRKLDRAKATPPNRLADLPTLLHGLRIRKYRHGNLVDGIWALRGRITAYDAAYVVLARLLAAPLVTRDRRLARTIGREVKVLTP